MYKYFLIFISTFICNCYAASQLDYGKSFVLGNAASPDKIQALYQDKKGQLYCGAASGLYLFDGIKFHLFTQADTLTKSVTAICENAKGEIILGYESGMIGILQQRTIIPLEIEEGFPKVTIKSLLYTGTDKLWIGTAGEGLYLKTNKHLYNYNTDDGLSDNYIYKIIAKDSTHVIAATDRGLNICYWHGGKKSIHTITAKNGLPDNIVRSITEGRNNTFWIGMQDAGIAKLEQDYSISYITPSWTYGTVNDLLWINNKLLVATADDGLIYFTPSENEKAVSTIQQQSSSPLTNICADQSGALWMAGKNELTFLHSFSLQTIIDLPMQQADFVYNLQAVSDKAFWFWNEKGLSSMFKIQGAWVEKKYPLPAIAHTQVSAIYRHPDGTIWIGTLGDGIFIFDEKNGSTKRLGNALVKDKINITSIAGFDNQIWVASFEGIIKIDVQNGAYAITQIQAAVNKYVYQIFIDSKKRLWLATDGDGLAWYENGKANWLKNTKGYKGNVVYKIAEDAAGKIWYATNDAGLVCYDFKHFQSWNEKNGLSEEMVTGIAAYKSKIFVFHTHRIDMLNTDNGAVDFIDQSNGIDAVSDDLNAYSISPDGAIYFVAANKICGFNSNDYKTLKPSIYINKIELFLKEGSYANGHVFNHNQNNLGFFFSGFYYPHPEQLQYAYKLDGYDKAWIATNDKSKVFSNLPPGRYTFHVKTGLGSNLTNANEASFSFVIEKPFWWQTWFIIGLIIAIGAVIFFIIQYRETQIKKWNSLQNEKINLQLQTLRNQINPHFLFNSFNILVSEIETQPEQAVEYVEKLSDFYRSVVMYRDKDLIPLQEELHILEDYIYLQKKRFSNAFQVSIKLENTLKKPIFIPPMALQLLVENAIKHNVVSNERPLHVSISEKENCIIVTNAIQYKSKPEEGTRMGLDNLASRYLLLSGSKIIIENDSKNFSVKIPNIKK